jgi:hypothetical protein
MEDEDKAFKERFPFAGKVWRQWGVDGRIVGANQNEYNRKQDAGSIHVILDRDISVIRILRKTL